MNELFNVKDKVVVITGGAGILGKGIAAYLAKEGAKVVVLDRSEEAGKALVESIKAEGNEAMFLYTDVMDKEVLEGNKVEIMKAYGRIDVLLNAAGGNMAGATIAPDKTFFDLQIDAFKKVVDLKTDYDSVEYEVTDNFSKEDIIRVPDATIKIQIKYEFEFNLKLSSLLKRNFLLSSTQLRRLFEQGVISLLSGKEPQKYKVKDGDILLMDKEHLLVMMDFVDSFMVKTGID